MESLHRVIHLWYNFSHSLDTLSSLDTVNVFAKIGTLPTSKFDIVIVIFSPEVKNDTERKNSFCTSTLNLLSLTTKHDTFRYKTLFVT